MKFGPGRLTCHLLYIVYEHCLETREFITMIIEFNCKIGELDCRIITT